MSKQTQDISHGFPFTDLTHEDIKDPRGDGQREGGEEDSEEPRGGVHGGVKALSLEMHVQLGQLFLWRAKSRSYTFKPSLPYIL